MNSWRQIGAGTLLSFMIALSFPVQGQTINAGIRSSDGVVREKKEHRFKMNSGQLHIEVGAVQIEGYTGDEVIITTMVETQQSTDERAQGLRKINSSGLNDNTGLNISKTQTGDMVELRQIQSVYQDTVFIRMPAHLSVRVGNVSLYPNLFLRTPAGGVTISNFRGEIEITQSYDDIRLVNVTGPATVKNNFGNIEAVFTEPVQGPISLISTQGFVDVALPTQVKADIELRASMGELFASPDFDIEVEEPVRANPKVAYVVSSPEIAVEEHPHATSRNGGIAVAALPSGLSSHIKGKINGGGAHISIRAHYGKIYLRTID